MNFLAPFFLLGAFAIAAPILFHLIRRTTREKTRFSSLLFLQPNPPRLTQRSRIENWLLLFLRAAALALLALAFARPFIRTGSPPITDSAKGRRQIILVDTSASMKRPDLETAARSKAEELVRAAQPGDQVALWTFDSATRRLMDFTDWTALPAPDRASIALIRLAEVRIQQGSASLATALTTAAEVLAEVPPGQAGPQGGEIIVLSDLPEGSRLEGLQGWEWPQDVFVTAVPLTPKQPGNAGLHLAPDASNPPAGEEPKARVRVWNASDSREDQFQVGWAASSNDSFVGKGLDVTVPPGQSRVVRLAWPPGGAGMRLLLKGDAEPFDNTVFAAPPSSSEVAAFYFGAEAVTDAKKPLFFLSQALPQTRQVTVKLTALASASAPPAILPGQPALFFVNGAIPPAHAEFLHQQLVLGKTALITLTNATAAPTLATLTALPLAGLNLEDIQPATYGMLSAIDFQHPLFAPFADPRFSDFTKIRFWNYTKFNAAALPGSRVIAQFDSGDPALVEVPVGAGRLIVLASGWQPESSQLALSSKFVPLLSSLMEWSGALITPPAQFLVGPPVAMNLLGLSGAGPVTVQQPDSTSVTINPDTPVFTGSTQPGLYTASAGTLTKTFAVNLDPAESRTTPMATDELDRLGVPQHRSGRKESTKNDAGLAPAVETENRQKLWRWIIAAAIAVLLIETLLAGLGARRVPAPQGAPV